MPGAVNPEQFWDVLNGKDTVLRQARPEEWRMSRACFDTAAEIGNGIPHLLGGYISGFESFFDPEGFSLPSSVVREMDSVCQWGLHTVRDCLKDASLFGSSVFSRMKSALVLANLSLPTPEFSSFCEGGRGKNIASGRFMSGRPARLVAQALSVNGRAFSLDAACASSLYGIHSACSMLSSGEADIVLAGAVNRADQLFLHMGFQQLGALSLSGRSLPFQEDADGLIPSEGAACVALMREKDALYHGLQIRGYIRAVGLSNDGRSRGFLQPSPEGQIAAMEEAYRMSAVRPEQISYLELHATGTRAGDLAELQALEHVFGGGLSCPAGSLKGHFGHLLTVSGMASVLKVLEIFQHGRIPPSFLHGDRPLAGIVQAGLCLNREPKPWAEGDGLAAISAFGFGGNNAHLILESPGQLSVRRSPKRFPDVRAASFQAPGARSVVLTGIALRMGAVTGIAQLGQLLRQESPDKHMDMGPLVGDLVLDLPGIASPPSALRQAHPQQLLLLELFQTLERHAGSLSHEKTGFFAGMETDPDVARWGYLWRSGQKGLQLALTPEGVLGTLPNIVANRVSRAGDLRGPALTFSSDAYSGLDALNCAIDMIRSGKLETAFAAAVDFSCHPIHQAALSAEGKEQSSCADGAVMLLLRSEQAAEREGCEVLGRFMLTDEAAGPVQPSEFSGGAWAVAGLYELVKQILRTAVGSVRQICLTEGHSDDQRVWSCVYRAERQPVDYKKETAPSSWQLRIPPRWPAVLPPLPAVADKTEPCLTREDLIQHSRGSISELFGSQFRDLDHYKRLVRMPQPPLLLADRVLKMEGVPGSMGQGMIRTETDITDDGFRCFHGYMLPGLLVEAGQADLLLISWLGADFFNRGEKVYRLLGCELTYHGDLPAAGQTLRFDIHLERHILHGESRLFCFRSDCYETGSGRKVLSVRNGQAGFFSEAELAKSRGILWKPEQNSVRDQEEASGLREPPPDCRLSFSDEQILAFSEGRIWHCFGSGYEFAAAHRRSPGIPSGKRALFHRVTECHKHGGHFGRGYLRAELTLSPDLWFFAGHFKNDPCMPGTLMLEGCFQVMAFRMVWQGLSLQRDGWRFRPLAEQSSPLICRGQVSPGNRLLSYELHVREICDGPEVCIRADILCTVDGLRAFLARNIGLVMVPDWPVEEELSSLVEKVSVPEGLNFSPGICASSLGRPSDAFGDMYRKFDSGLRIPRLPAPPFRFVDKILRFKGEAFACGAGSELDVLCSLSEESWYIKENPQGALPFVVLLEVALQGCGILASLTGATLRTPTELFFRNLGGRGRVHVPVTDVGQHPVRSQIRLLRVSQMGATVIMAFEIACFMGEQLIAEFCSDFGLFPEQAFADQAGLLADEEADLFAAKPANMQTELRGFSPCFPYGDLLMVDRITGFWPEGGRAGLGVIRGEKEISPDDWYFRAHFFQDPVQPGSLGLEGLLQLLRWYYLFRKPGRPFRKALWSAACSTEDVLWKYRGQVRPNHKKILYVLGIASVREGADSTVLSAYGSLWCDGLRIYQADSLVLQVQETQVTDGEHASDLRNRLSDGVETIRASQ
ncbi:MAG: hypothetical protein H6618_03135 [Deltaproteobacteria bacterium]|nr:hypothetical protein [Deltaproteobacteria bacterium]